MIRWSRNNLFYHTLSAVLWGHKENKMAKFFKNLFSHNAISSEKKKASKSKPDLMSSEDDDREFSAPYDTRRKMSVSRSGRMKQNLKQRGALANDLYGDEVSRFLLFIKYLCVYSPLFQRIHSYFLYHYLFILHNIFVRLLMPMS